MANSTPLTLKSQENQERSFYSMTFNLSTNKLPPFDTDWLSLVNPRSLTGSELVKMLTTPHQAKTKRGAVFPESRRVKLLDAIYDPDTPGDEAINSLKKLDSMKAQGGWVVFGRSNTDRRRKGDMATVCAVGLDVDDGAIPEQALRDKLTRAGLFCIYHSTAKHRQGAERWRVVVPLAYEVETYPTRQVALLEELSQLVGVEYDGQTKDPNRMLYLPVLCQGGQFFAGVIEGGLFDPQTAYHREADIKQRTHKAGAVRDSSTQDQLEWLEKHRQNERICGTNKDGSLNMATLPKPIQTTIVDTANITDQDRDAILQRVVVVCIGSGMDNPDELEQLLDRLELDNHPAGQKWAMYKAGTGGGKDRQLARAMAHAWAYIADEKLENEQKHKAQLMAQAEAAGVAYLFDDKAPAIGAAQKPSFMTKKGQ